MCRMADIFMKEKTVRYAKNVLKQCPTNALSVYGISKTVEEIAEEAYRDSMVFPEFGGVTFSGGECLLQATKCKENSRDPEAERNTYLHRYCFKCSVGYNRRNTAIYRSFS